MLKRLVRALLRRDGGADPAAPVAQAGAGPDGPLDPIAQAAACAAAGDHAAAAEFYRESLKRWPQNARAWCNLGAERDAGGASDEAQPAYRRALELDPGLVPAWYNLGRLLQVEGRAAEAETCYREAAARVDSIAERQLWLSICSNRGVLLYNQGRTQEAVALYREALARDGQAPELWSNLLLTMQYASGCTPAESFAEHRAYAQRFEAPLKERWLPHPNAPVSGKRLRIGYVSPDFRAHAVAFFIEPVLAHHDHEQIEVYCYCNHAKQDGVTLRLMSLVRHWRDIRALSDDETARRIREDGIDILVDLAGHTAGGRLQVFARKPAPVQVSWLGYPCTTGLAAMDYRISDAHADPVGSSEQYYSEALCRLPDAFDCYSPPHESPEVGALPAMARGGVTFGSFNNLAKLAPGTRALWAQLLLAVPGSRLLLKSGALADPAARQRLMSEFAGCGIVAERLILAPADATHYEHLNRYNQVDIGLDPFPYNGVTTSFEAVWMGVPVVTLAGNSFVSRMGVSMLAGLGMKELIADTQEDYVAIAARLAGDPGRLGTLRAGLRQRLSNSPLTDAARFTLNLERAYREMWAAWCGRTGDAAR